MSTTDGLMCVVIVGVWLIFGMLCHIANLLTPGATP